MTSGRLPQRVEWSEEDAGSGRVIRWETVERRRYLLIRNEGELNTWEIRKETPLRRHTPRRLKSAVLGRDGLF